MRGADVQQGGLFSYVSVESRIPANHPLRAVPALLDEALAAMSRDFDRVYAEDGRRCASGLTPAPTAPPRSASMHCRAGYTATTGIDRTPAWQDSRQPPDSASTGTTC